MPADITQATHMEQLLIKYATSVGLRINFQKSTLIPIDLQADEAQVFAALFECAIGQMSFTYLGLPLGTMRPSVSDLIPLVDLSQWKEESLWLRPCWTVSLNLHL
jgi:hypothetical protein